MRWIGLDVHRRSVQAAVLDDQTTPARQCRFSNTPEGWCEFCGRELRSETHLVLEATGSAWQVHDTLQAYGAAEVIVVDPNQVRAIWGARKKHDKADAQRLAELGRAGLLPRVYVPTSEERVFRTLTRQHKRLTQTETAYKNQVHQALAREGLHCPHDPFTLAGRAFLARCPLRADTRVVVDSALAVLDIVGQQLEAVDEAILHTLQQAPTAFQSDVEHLTTVFGVGAMAAVAFRARVGDPRRFPRSAHVASYLGMAPTLDASAETVRLGPISKRGDATVRWYLGQAAWTAIRTPGPLCDLFQRLEARKGPKIAIVAVARRLATLLFTLLRDGKPYEAAVERNVARKRTQMQRRAAAYSQAVEHAHLRLQRRQHRVAQILTRTAADPTHRPPEGGGPRTVGATT